MTNARNAPCGPVRTGRAGREIRTADVEEDGLWRVAVELLGQTRECSGRLMVADGAGRRSWQSMATLLLADLAGRSCASASMKMASCDRLKARPVQAEADARPAQRQIAGAVDRATPWRRPGRRRRRGEARCRSRSPGPALSVASDFMDHLAGWVHQFDMERHLPMAWVAQERHGS